MAIVRDVAGVISQRRPRTESHEGPRNFHCALFYMHGYVSMFPTLKRAGLLTKNV
jgi:hypothetical protein